MSQQNNAFTLTESTINGMIEARDFSRVENRVPELITFLLKASPILLKTAFEISLSNENIRKETNKYIHETSNNILKEYSSIARLEVEGLNETNKKLGEVLVQLSKKSEKTADEIRIYFATLQQIQQNHDRITDNVHASKRFLESVQSNEANETKVKKHMVANAFLKVIQTPEGNKQISEMLFDLSKSLYEAFTRS